MLCGRSAGTLIEREHRLSLEHAPAAPVIVANIDGLRCTVCDGNVMVVAVETRMVRDYEPFAKDEPRRGRPPRWLVDQRRAVAALAAQGRVPREGHW